MALADCDTPLQIVARKLNRSVASVRKKAAEMGISFPVLDEPLPRIGLRSVGGQFTWKDVDHVVVAGEYPFRDGIITIKSKHLNVWKKNPDAKFTLTRFLPANPGSQKYGLASDNQ